MKKKAEVEKYMKEEGGNGERNEKERGGQERSGRRRK